MNFRMNVVAFVVVAHAVCGYAHGHGHNHGAACGYDPFKAVDGALYGHGQKAHKEESSHQHGPGCHGGHDHGAKKEGSHGGCAEGDLSKVGERVGNHLAIAFERGTPAAYLLREGYRSRIFKMRSARLDRIAVFLL